MPDAAAATLDSHCYAALLRHAMLPLRCHAMMLILMPRHYC